MLPKITRPLKHYFIKDRKNGFLTGVCAGVARYFQQSVFLIRLVAVLMLLSFPLLTAVIYLLAAFFMPETRNMRQVK